MRTDVLGFQDVDRTAIQRVGGKGANLGELSRLAGINVPPGFCVTADVFQRAVTQAPEVAALLRQLSELPTGDARTAGDVGNRLRQAVEAVTIPQDAQDAITALIHTLGPRDAYAVRSSATAEDLPNASFAGQQDTFLNVTGATDVLLHVRRCWASLFTQRAIAYRQQHGFDHRKVHMAVVVQKMVPADAAGVMFTAHPLHGHRKVTSIEAVTGLGETLVSGHVTPDSYTVKDAVVLEKKLAREHAPVLTDAQLGELERLGRLIEAHFNTPQDVEWCLANGVFHVVQARPITTLFPIPEPTTPGNQVYLSVGHQQMMTDPMKVLGLSFFQMTAGRPMFTAAGRLFVNVTRELGTPGLREKFLEMTGRSDPLIRDALSTVVQREGFIAPLPPLPTPPSVIMGGPGPAVNDDPAVVDTLVQAHEQGLAALKEGIRTRSGTALLEFIQGDLQELKKLLMDPRSMAAIMASMNAVAWLNDNMLAWLGEQGVADALAQSVPNNVTSEMGLALLDVADVIRPYPAVVAYLQHARDQGFLEGLLPLHGGPQAHDAIRTYLDRYGMRCTGEIDLTRPRWTESPTTLAAVLLSNVRNFEPGAGKRRFEKGLQEAQKKQADLLARLRALPDGETRAAETERVIRRLRMFSGFREYPKYAIVSRYAVYKQALLEEAQRLVHAGVLDAAQDIHHLTFEELRDVVRTQTVDRLLLQQRQQAHEQHRALRPPRVITSDGEMLNGAYRRTGLPPDALVGLPVSSGVVEGRARVVLDLAGAHVEAGDILVTAFTDPGWTPLFVSIQGLVTEVGGLTTHGAVIAREYGLPAVIGVAQATTRIRDGQRIRLNGTEGYVELLA